MTWRFRKSFSPLPGVRITLSPSGVSTSVGVGPFRATVGPRGPAFSTNIPGTGLSFRQTLGDSSDPSRGGSAQSPAFSPVQSLPEPTEPEINDIKSAGSGTLTTPGLTEFKRLLEQARHEHGEIIRDLAHARSDETEKVGTYTSWKNGRLLRRIFKAKFQQHQAAAEDSSAKRAELEEQEALSRLQTQIELPDGVAAAFHRMCDEFSILAKSDRIWDTVGQRDANQMAERTTATRVIQRKSVRFRLGRCELIESEWKVPHLENANGGDIFFYPAFALYFLSSDSFALLEYKDIQIESSASQFIEEESLPSDTKIVGHTWAKANKDGSPDKRFKGNYQIPIVQYGKIVIASATGMNEEYMISNAEHTEVFSKAWLSLAIAVRAGV